MFKNTITRKVLYPITTATLVIGGTIVAPANAALPSENVYNSGAGGMTNCTGDGVCIEKVGDEIEVSYEVQMSNMLSSIDHGQTVAGSMIAFPSVIQDPKLEVVSTSIETRNYKIKVPGEPEDYSESFMGYPAHKFDKPIEVPTLTPDEVEEGHPYDGGEISFVVDNIDNIDDDSSYIKTYGDDYFYATHIKGEKILEDYKKTGKNSDTIKDMSDVNGISKESKIYNASLEKAGAMPVNSTYDYFTFDNDTRRGVNTYRVSGKVKSESDLGFLPIRAKQGFWKCGQEGNGFGFTDNREWRLNKRENGKGCQNLMDYEWARSDDNLPEYSLENDEVTRNNIKNNTEHGLAGSKKCAVTEDTGRYDLIGQDIEPRKIEEDGDSVSWGNSYSKEFNLHAYSMALNYFAGSYNFPEDGCDQAGVKIELCNKDTPDETPSTTPEETPGTTPKKTPSTTTVEDTPSKNTTTPVETTTPKATTPKATTPKATTPVKTTSVEDTPEDTPNTTIPNTIVKPGAKTIIEPRKVTPSIPNEEYVPVENVTPVKESDGPSVNTGGELEKNTFFTKVLSVFA